MEYGIAPGDWTLSVCTWYCTLPAPQEKTRRHRNFLFVFVVVVVVGWMGLWLDGPTITYAL
jgi:hypothetical protein